jgi:hypothetical protein
LQFLARRIRICLSRRPISFAALRLSLYDLQRSSRAAYGQSVVMSEPRQQKQKRAWPQFSELRVDILFLNLEAVDRGFDDFLRECCHLRRVFEM